MSNEVILNLSFDNQTVTDLTGNWTLDGTPNATYEQIEGRDGYSIVTGSLGRCIVLNAVDQNAVYDEYTVDFDMFVKSTYTSDYYFYNIMYMWSLINPGSEYCGKIGNVLDMCLKIGGSERYGTTNYSPIGRWVHVTLTSGPTEVDYQYYTTVYVDGIKLIDRIDTQVAKSPFALSQQILLLTRDTEAKLMPNGPGICLNTFKVVTGIHMPNQKPAISLLNLSRVFNNFCTWLKEQLSTVAFTGSYNDLSNKPTISTVNDGTLTIQQNGTNVQTFTANASTNKTANIQCVDLSTAQTIGGVKTFSSNVIIQGSKKVTCNLDNSFIELDGGTTWGKGGSIVISGQDRSSYTNSVLIVSKSDTNTDILQYQNGELKPLSNNTNNSSLGTSTNKWSKVYSDDVVHTTGDETIGGVKTFSNLRTYFGRDISCYSTRKYGKNLNPTSNTYQYLNFSGNTVSDGATNDWSSGYLEQVVDTNGGSRGRWFIQDTSENVVGLELWASGNDKQVRPYQNGNTDLGTSTKRWKSFNGINPGALSLQGSSAIDISSNITVLDGTTANKFTPQINGWLHINGTGPANDAFIYAVQGRVGMRSGSNQASFRCAVLIPVVAGAEVAITCKLSTLTWANITPCQGNV